MVTTRPNPFIDCLKVFFVLVMLLVPFCSCDQNEDTKSISKSGIARSNGRVPTLKFIDKEERGCGRVQFCKGSEDRREYLVVQIDMVKLGISDG